jgi:hypothetical protein
MRQKEKRFQRIKLGTETNGVTINSLDDFMQAHDRFTGPGNAPVSNAQVKTIGSFSGKQFDFHSSEFLSEFVFIQNGYVYEAYWPKSTDQYSGTYQNQQEQIISSMTFSL